MLCFTSHHAALPGGSPELTALQGTAPPRGCPGGSSVTADLCACRTAPSARRRGRRTSCAPTATAGCAARVPRSTGTALPPGARSFPAPTRDRQVALPAVLPGSRAPKQHRTTDFQRVARSHLVSLLGVRVGVASEPFSGDRFMLGSPFEGGQGGVSVSEVCREK